MLLNPAGLFCVDLAGLKLGVFLARLPKYWDYKYVLLYLAFHGIFFSSLLRKNLIMLPWLAGNRYRDQAGLKLTETCLRLPPECWS